MKIYNKKVFASGVFEMALGLLLLITSITRQDLDMNSIILIVALFAFGFGSIMRSISQRMAKEDKLEELVTRAAHGADQGDKGLHGRGAGVFPLPLGRRRRAGCACEGE